MIKNRGFTQSLENGIASHKPMPFFSVGFTLIELLVVIAIIGVISSIVMASLNNSRVRANDAKIKTQLSGIRTAAELYYNGTGNNTYGTAVDGTQAAIPPNFGKGCSTNMFTDPLLDPYTATAAYPSGTAMKCTSTVSAHQVTASLSGTNLYWCINSAGLSKQITGTTHDLAHPISDVDCTP